MYVAPYRGDGAIQPRGRVVVAIEAAHAELVRRGVDVGAVFTTAGGCDVFAGCYVLHHTNPVADPRPDAVTQPES